MTRAEAKKALARALKHVEHALGECQTVWNAHGAVPRGFPEYILRGMEPVMLGRVRNDLSWVKRDLEGFQKGDDDASAG